MIYRKFSLIKLNCYHISGRKEDLDLFIRMFNSGYKAQNLNESLLLYRSNAENLQRRKLGRIVLNIFKYYMDSIKKVIVVSLT